jgi:hypothetical protein
MTARTLLIVAAVAATLAGCSPDAGDGASAGEMEPGSRDATPALAGVRETLSAEDIGSAALPGELACAFTERGATGSLLVAMADVVDDARAEGLLRLGVSTLRLQADDTGGFNAMVHGTSFTSGDLAARVTVTSKTPTAGGESPPLPARLEISTDAGSQRVEGEWTCGP